jgi:hypothetical protein
MISSRNDVRSALSVVLTTAVIFAVLKHHLVAESMLWILLVAVAAALSLHILTLCSSTSLNSHQHDEE